MEQSIFEQSICDVDGLRTIYYALNALSPDNPGAEVWRPALSDALREFTNKLSQAITAPPPDLGDDFICNAVRLVLRGADRASLNAEFGLDICLPAPAQDRSAARGFRARRTRPGEAAAPRKRYRITGSILRS
jgi:hypothetical protein